MLCFQACSAHKIPSMFFPLWGCGSEDNSQDDLGSFALIAEPPSACIPENWREYHCPAEVFACPKLLDKLDISFC